MKPGVPLLLSILLSSAAMSAGAQTPPPRPYIDKGACPFEGCAYRAWVAKKQIPLFAKPGSKKQIGVVHAGERVIGVTGEVHSIPILVHAAENIPDPGNPNKMLIPKGAAFYVIHYVGEGTWLCWYNGASAYVDHLSDRGPFPAAAWWVEVKTSSGLTGWTISNGNFDGQDALG